MLPISNYCRTCQKEVNAEIFDPDNPAVFIEPRCPICKNTNLTSSNLWYREFEQPKLSISEPLLTILQTEQTKEELKNEIKELQDELDSSQERYSKMIKKIDKLLKKYNIKSKIKLVGDNDLPFFYDYRISLYHEIIEKLKELKELKE